MNEINKLNINGSVYNLKDSIPQGYCDTAASTLAKEAQCTGFVLTDKSYIMVDLTTTNTYDGKITLDINSTGAKDIYINGEVSSSTNKTLPAGSYLVYYEDNKYYFRTDGKISGQGVVSPDGSSLDMQVDEAINLVGETSKEDVFLYRPTADHIHIYPDAKIESIKGNTVVWNQLIEYKNNNTYYTTQDNIEFVISSNKITINGTATTGTNAVRFSKNGYNFIKDHKYLYKGVTGGSDETYRLVISSTKAFPNNNRINIFDGGTIATASNNESVAATGIYLQILSGTTVSNLVVVPQLYDLTLMFGEGNEPSTVEEFEEWLADNVGLKDYYPYNEGELIPTKVTGIKTVGFNQWDEEWEVGTISTVNGGNTSGTDRIRSKYYCKCIPNALYYQEAPDSQIKMYFYDNNKNFITSTDWSGTANPVTSPANAAYFKFTVYPNYGTTYNNDICTNLHHSGSRDGEYEPYWTETKQIPIISLTGKLNGEGSSVVVFPDGMKKAGNVCDEIKVENGVTKAIKRIGSVDLGSLKWTTASTSNVELYGYRMKNSTTTIIPVKAVSAADTANILCCKYETIPAGTGGTHSGKVGVSIDTSSRVTIYDTNYNTEDSASAFKTAMDGVLLYYELDTPEEYILDTFELPLDYHVDDYGTEEQLLPASVADELTSCTANLNITYGINARDSIRRLPYNYVSAVLKLNFTESLKALARRNIGVLLADEDPSLDNIALIEDDDSSATIADLVYITDKQGNRVLPITHIDSVRDSNGNPLSSLLPLTMGASGSNHSGGLVPDTPSTSGTTKFLREDGTWAVPADIDTNTTYKFTIGSTTNGDSTNGVSLGSLDSETAVANGTDLSLVTTGEKAIWNAKTSNEGTVTGVTVGTGGTNYTPTNGVVTIPAYPTTLPASDVSSWAKADNKPSYAYSEIGYTVNPVSNSSTTLSLDGTTPIHVVTTTAAITSLTLSQNPSEGHSCHVILTASTDKSVTIPANLTNVVYPDGEGPIDLEIPAGGYVEVDFIMSNNKVYVRAIL